MNINNQGPRKNEIPMVWAQKDVRKKDDLAPLRAGMQRQGRTGVYYVLKSMEQGPSFRIAKPKFAVADPTWRIISPQRSRYTHLYFYIIDEQIGPFAMRIGAFLPFYATYYLNGQHRWRGAVFRGSDVQRSGSIPSTHPRKLDPPEL